MSILVTTDGSPDSLRAIPHAARFAQATAVDLLFLRVLDPPGSAEQGADALGVANERIRAEAQSLVTDAGIRSDVSVVFRGKDEKVADAIIRIAAERDSGVIAMATRGAGLARRMFGSVATSVLTAAPLPVMLVGPHVATRDISSKPYRILVTSDGSNVSEAVVPALRRALESAPTGNLEARFLRVYQEALGDPPRHIAMEACHRQLSALKENLPQQVAAEIEVRELVPFGGVDTAILGTATEHQVDAVWMGTHGHSFRQHILLGSVAIQVLGRGSVPVVLVRAVP